MGSAEKTQDWSTAKMLCREGYRLVAVDTNSKGETWYYLYNEKTISAGLDEEDDEEWYDYDPGLPWKF